MINNKAVSVIQIKRFSKLDEGFICENCGREVPPLGYTSRNHCPYCLHSKHVDINPGDRLNDCGGMLVPIQTMPDPKKGFIIIFRCKKCNKLVRNLAATREGELGDDKNLLIKLTNPDNGK